MIYGGLPQVASFQTERQKVEYLKNIYVTFEKLEHLLGLSNMTPEGNLAC